MSKMDIIQEKAASIFGSSNAQLTPVVLKVIDECGGIDQLIKKFQDKGLGDIVQSWISNTPNKSVTSDQIVNVLGSSLLQKVAGKSGMTPETLSQQLATYLPLLLDKLTPEGTVPHEGWYSRGIDKAKEFFGMGKDKH